MSDDPVVIPTSWVSGEIVDSDVVDGHILRLRLKLSCRRPMGRVITARIDTRRPRAQRIIGRLFEAADAAPSNHSRALHNRAMALRLAIEHDENVIVDARSLTRRRA